MSIKRQSYVRQSVSKVSQSQISQSLSLNPQAKIHRANIICRILHSYCLNREENAFQQIWLIARNKVQGPTKISFALNSIFRRFSHEEKFNAFYLIKKQSLIKGGKLIKQAEKKLKNMNKSSANLIYLTIKSKKSSILKDAFEKIKEHARTKFYEDRAISRKSIRKIQQILLKNKKFAFNKLMSTRIILERKQKMKIVGQMLKNKLRQQYQWAMWKFNRNCLSWKKQQIKDDIKQFQQKIANHKDPQIQVLRQKRGKLEQHLMKIRKQKQQMQQQYQAQFKDIQTQKGELTKKLKDLEESNRNLQENIRKTEEQINAPYTLDEIYQMVYHNFLLYLHENKEEVYNKQKALQALTIPLVPIQVPVESIKEENQVMKQLLNEYIVIFGPQKLQTQIEMPYEYLLKQNHAMYKMLVTLLPQLDSEREDLQVLRDNVHKLSNKVNELWGE